MRYFNINKKGFTLVELLAVIVILALVMGIAVVSMSGVQENAKIGVIKSSAAGYAEGIGKLLQLNMAEREGDFYIHENALEKKVSSPWGQYVYYSGSDTALSAPLQSNGYVYAGAVGTLKCGGASASGSFVRIEKSGSHYVKSICLYDNQGHFVFASEGELVKSNADKNDYYRESTQVTDTEYTLTNGKISVVTP